MGGLSIWHLLITALPFIFLVAIIGMVVLLLRKPGASTAKVSDNQAALVATTQSTVVSQTLSAPQADKLRWMAAAGYIFALSDAYLTQLMGFYQFYAFGALFCLPTLVPFVIFYLINKTHVQPIITVHLQSAVRLYALYVVGSVVNGVLLSNIGNGLVHTLFGVGLSIFMLGVLVWLSIRCVQGIIAAFNLVMPEPVSGLLWKK